LDLLNDGLQDHFSDIFPIRSVSEGLLKWDELFTWVIRACLVLILFISKPILSASRSAKPVVEFSDPVAAADSLDALLFSIPSLLRDALGSRAEVIDVRKLVRTKEWPISAQWTDTNDLAEQRLLVGCVLSEETVGVVEHGPSSEDADGARKFKSVWGELADLRRFRDGSIRYSVVWEPPKYPDNAAEGGWGWVLRRAIPHLLKRHFGMAETAIYNAKIDSALKALHDEQVAPGEAFDELSKRLRALENLPLSVLSVALASSSTVKCDPARYLLPKGSQPPMEVIIEFEHTSRWPDDLEAIQKMKLAFGLRIAEQFRLQFSGTASSVGGFGEDAGASDPSLARILAHSYVDIVTERGLAFRCRLLVERERHLLETALASPLTAAETKPSLEQALERYRTLYVNAPYHALHLHNRCTEFPGLAWTICLAKLWLARHLLSLHFSDELVELVCLSLYTNPGPNALPKSGAGGFLRFLERLADWDWRNDPLIVELHKGELTPAVRTSIEAAFKSLRASAANTARTAMFAATEVEVGSRQHSFSNLSWVILDRARMLARSGVALVSSSIRDGNPDKLKVRFTK
jgi:U3 small nucleolar RNA-associated protein 22